MGRSVRDVNNIFGLESPKRKLNVYALPYDLSWLTRSTNYRKGSMTDSSR